MLEQVLLIFKQQKLKVVKSGEAFKSIKNLKGCLKILINIFLGKKENFTCKPLGFTGEPVSLGKKVCQVMQSELTDDCPTQGQNFEFRLSVDYAIVVHSLVYTAVTIDGRYRQKERERENLF